MIGLSVTGLILLAVLGPCECLKRGFPPAAGGLSNSEDASPRYMQPLPLKWRPFNLREEVGEPIAGSSRGRRIANSPPYKRWNPHPVPASSHSFDSHSNQAFFGGSSSGSNIGGAPSASYHRANGPSLQDLSEAAHTNEEVDEDFSDDGRPKIDLGMFVNGLKSRIRNEISLLLAVAPEESLISTSEESSEPAPDLRTYFSGHGSLGGGPSRSHTRKFLPLPLLRGGLTRH